MDKVLLELESKENRKAKFQTVITLIIDGNETQFHGEVLGTIRKERSGEDGFGYDPIFEPIGYDITFSEMEMTQKNEISHRGIAVKKLIKHLNTL